MFKYNIHDKVRLIAFGLNYEGRIVRQIRDNGDTAIYDVDYCSDGSIKRQEFYEYDLEAIN